MRNENRKNNQFLCGVPPVFLAFFASNSDGFIALSGLVDVSPTSVAFD